MAGQDDILRDIILDLVPSDGSNVGNQALLALLQDRIPTITEDAYQAARDALVEDGILGKGRGRGGSVHLVVEDGEDDGFGLEETEEDLTPRQSAMGTRRRRAAPGPAQVVSYRHPDRRLNNPEVGLVHPENDPDAGKTRWAYDPHIHPALMFDSGRAQIETLIDDALASGDADTMRDALAELKRLQAPYLNWTGKAERTSFEVDTVSLHVHERIDPASILRAVRKRLAGGDGFAEAEQLELFQPAFEEPPLRQALDFYAHEKGWANRLIAGDSLLVMNSLLQKESMAGRVQMVYIDPPYGIKYGSNFQPFVNKRDVKDRSDEDLTAEPEMIKAFRDTWELGIHSYLTYLRDRLLLARELLSDSGSVFVQISDNNLHHIRELMDDVFGADQVVGIVTFKKTSGAGSPSGGTEVLASVSDYLIWYAKDRSKVKYRQLYKDKEVGGDVRPTLVINWERVSTLTLDPASTPISADVAPALGGAADMSKVVAIDLEKLPDGFRLQRSIFVAARKAFATLEGQFKGAPDYLVLQLIRIVEQFLTSDRMVIPSLFHSDPLRKRILIALNIDLIVQHLLEFTKEQNTESLEPVYDEDRPVGRTGDMRTWFTAKPARPAEKSHISHVVGDAAWEQYAANIFEKSSDVTSFAKNDHLGFEVFYLWGGSRRRYIPDFLVRMANGKTLVLEIKGQDSPQNRAKREALGEWIAAVNSVGGFGTWCWDLAFSPAAVHDIIAKHGV